MTFPPLLLCCAFASVHTTDPRALRVQHRRGQAERARQMHSTAPGEVLDHSTAPGEDLDQDLAGFIDDDGDDVGGAGGEAEATYADAMEKHRHRLMFNAARRQTRVDRLDGPPPLGLQVCAVACLCAWAWACACLTVSVGLCSASRPRQSVCGCTQVEGD